VEQESNAPIVESSDHVEDCCGGYNACENEIQDNALKHAFSRSNFVLSSKQEIRSYKKNIISVCFELSFVI
jgi:hypothetical protein